MRMLPLFFTLFLFLSGCKSDEICDIELHNFVTLLNGNFSSREQAERESGYYNIGLSNISIWKNQPGFWIYQELFNSENPKKIYTQRILKIERVDSITISSSSYIIPNQKKYSNGWKKASIFDQLRIDSLKIRSGCEVYFRKKTSSIYQGKTNNRTCTSNSIKNVAYITSNVVISHDIISSWDRGYTIDGKQIWGKIQGPYIYKRISDD
ncbi:hypothetical protein AB832_03285 [Flavobacteriaceae bacterium (ex Bugula neritina AB1)]|nr:hypothetical protein AB832_03285 [Flavobacteriaceae bacterium (ex Bugula neritina AB1)]